MKIETNFEISNEEESNLAQVLNCEEEDLPHVLSSYSNAALREYIDLFLGQKTLKRGIDILEYRLFLLITHVLHEIPNEQKVTSLFQTTLSESRAIIRSVLSKFQYKLQGEIENSLRDILRRARPIPPDNGPYYVVIPSQNLVESLNKILVEIDVNGNLSLVSKQRTSVATYVISRGSHDELIRHLDLDRDQNQYE